MKKTAKVILRAFFAMALITSVGFLRASAASNILTVIDASILSKSDGVTATISSFANNEIESDVTFNKVNDQVTYQLSIENTGSQKLTIKSITNNAANDYIEYSYGSYADTELAVGESFNFNITATYKNAIPSSSARNQNLNITLNFTFETEDGQTGGESIAINPTTNDNIWFFVGIAAVSVIGLIISIILIRRSNKKSKIAGVAIAAVVAAGVALPAIVKASDDYEPIVFKGNHTIMSRLVVSYNDGTEDQTLEINNGDTLEGLLNDPNVPGQNFSGWLNEDGSEFNPTQPVTGDITIHPSLTPIHYTIAIDTDGDGDVDVTIPATYGAPVNLPDNEASKPGHTPDGWTDGTNTYSNGQTVNNLTTEDGGTVNLAPNFAPNHYSVNIDTDGDGQADISFDVTYGNEANLPNNEATKTGYTANGWTDGTNHYDNGADISGLVVTDGGSVTITPDWTRDTYVITIDPGEGTLPGDSEISGYYGDTVSLPTPTAPEGKKFTGWYDEDGNKLNSTITISSTTTVYAHYRTIAAEAEWWNGSLNNMYMKELNQYATTFKHYATDPQPDDNYSSDKYKVVSTQDSPAKIYLWVDESDENVINWWTEAATVRLHHQYANDMFNGLSKLKNIDLSGIDMSTATTFANFFRGTAIESINLSSWSASNFTNMANMFSECGQLTTVTFGNNFNTSKVTNMSGLFDGTTSLQSVDMGSLNTEKVRNMAFMFRSSGIGTLDLSNFSTPALTNTQLMFSGATNLTTIYASADFDLSHVTGTDYHSLAYDYNMFINTDSLAGGAGTAFSSSNPRNKTYARIDDPDNNKPGYFTKKNARYVRFNANGGESVGTVSSHYMSTTTAEELPSSGFTLEGHRLAGWNTAADGNGTSYSLGAYMTAPAGNTPLVLYAQWEEASSGSEYEAMQSMTTAKCAEMEVGTMVNLQDTRDNKVYRVGKLADNNCWMLDTLKIANVEISDEDSDLPEDTTFVLLNSNNDAFEKETKNTPKLYIDPNNNHGVFYSYYTATAGWGVYGNDNLAATTTDSPQSICPKGWKLPNGGNSYAGDFNNLVSIYGQDQTAYMGEFPGFELDGALYSSNGKVAGPADYGHSGYFWSSTNRSKWFANRFLIVDDVQSPENSGIFYDFNYYKYWENNIVCMAR